MATVLKLEGNANDLLQVDNTFDMKMTRLVKVGDEDPASDEVVDVAITSVDPSRTHKFFNDQIVGKKLTVTIDAEDI